MLLIIIFIYSWCSLEVVLVSIYAVDLAHGTRAVICRIFRRVLRYLLPCLPWRVLLLDEVAWVFEAGLSSLPWWCILVITALLAVVSPSCLGTGWVVSYVRARALKAVTKLGGVHRRRTLWSHVAVQVRQTVSGQVRLSLIDVCVRYHHVSQLILATCLREVGLVWIVGLLSAIYVHVLVLESVWVLRNLKHRLGWLRISLIVTTTIWLSWLLGSPSRLVGGICGGLAHHKAVLRNILHQLLVACNYLAIVLSFHLNLLQLLLELNLLLLLGGETLSLVAVISWLGSLGNILWLRSRLTH